MRSQVPCHNHGVHCMNMAVAESDLGDGRGVHFYCRRCIENFSDLDNIEPDNSLVFCKREWEAQEN